MTNKKVSAVKNLLKGALTVLWRTGEKKDWTDLESVVVPVSYGIDEEMVGPLDENPQIIPTHTELYIEHCIGEYVIWKERYDHSPWYRYDMNAYWGIRKATSSARSDPDLVTLVLQKSETYVLGRWFPSYRTKGEIKDKRGKTYYWFTDRSKVFWLGSGIAAKAGVK